MGWSWVDFICGGKAAQKAASDQLAAYQPGSGGDNNLTLDNLIAAVKEFNVPKFLACKDAKVNIYLHNTDKLNGTLLHEVVRQAADKPEKMGDAVRMYLAICNSFDPERLEEMKRAPDIQHKKAMEYARPEFMKALKDLMQAEKIERKREGSSSSSLGEHLQVTTTKEQLLKRRDSRYGLSTGSGDSGNSPNSNGGKHFL